MTIDAHQHFWKYNSVRDTWIDDSKQVIRRDFMPADLKPILDKNDVDACISIQADQSEEETNFLLDLADKNDFIKAVVGWVNLCDKNIEERLTHFSKHTKFKGIRHIVQAESIDFLLGDDFLNGISKLKKHDLIYEILIRKEQLENTIKLVAKFPNQIFVLDHIAKPNIKGGEIEPWKSQIEELATYKNVHCKVSGLVTEADLKNHNYIDFTPYLDVIFNAFGIDRILFGSDWPVCLLASSYTDTKSIVEKYLSSSFTEGEKDKVMGGNAFNLYLN